MLYESTGRVVASLGYPIDDRSEDFKRLWLEARSEAQAGRTFAAQVKEGFEPVELISSAPLC